jgi:hypothetical protein
MLTELVAGAALAVAGWAVKQAAKVEPLEDNVKHIRDRVDALYDHLIEGRPTAERKGR